MDVTQVVTVMLVMATNLGTVIVLYCHQDNKTTAFLKAIQEEMKDFHTKLALQDQEFKMRLCAIEERGKK